MEILNPKRMLELTAIDISRDHYEVGLPYIKDAGLAHKINFIESPATPALNQLLSNQDEKLFDFAFVDANKTSYNNTTSC
ncbi:unnamed protein product [Linum tenue]|nr:unnamed protein product [Linum tenue]